jgi:hypothetical protein
MKSKTTLQGNDVNKKPMVAKAQLDLKFSLPEESDFSKFTKPIPTMAHHALVNPIDKQAKSTITSKKTEGLATSTVPFFKATKTLDKTDESKSVQEKTTAEPKDKSLVDSTRTQKAGVPLDPPVLKEETKSNKFYNVNVKKSSAKAAKTKGEPVDNSGVNRIGSIKRSESAKNMPAFGKRKQSTKSDKVKPGHAEEDKGVTKETEQWTNIQTLEESEFEEDSLYETEKGFVVRPVLPTKSST